MTLEKEGKQCEISFGEDRVHGDNYGPRVAGDTQGILSPSDKKVR